MSLTYAIADHVLPNGLRVVVNEDHATPTVAVNLWVGVGSRHEEPGRTGFAHLFEHLMFQGSANVASGEHFSVLMGQGARLNATTWFDRTNYYETLPRGALDLALWMEADRHGYLLEAVTQANLDNQRDVVKEEKRQRYDNVPYGDALHVLYAHVFPDGHPYHHPTIGSMADLDAATLDDVHAFFRAHYRPSNTVLTLAGDVTAEEGLEAAARYFGDIPDAAVARREPAPALPPSTEPIRLERVADVPTDRLYLAFRLPVDNTPQFFAAASALEAIGGLSISRLERHLVRDLQVCTSVSAASMGLVDGTSLGFIIADATDGVGLDRVEELVCADLEAFADGGPTQAEAEGVLAQGERAWLSSLAALDERADHIGQLTTLYDDPDGINTMLDRIAAVTAQDVQAAAATWVTPSARVTLAYRRDETLEARA